MRHVALPSGPSRGTRGRGRRVDESYCSSVEGGGPGVEGRPTFPPDAVLPGPGDPLHQGRGKFHSTVWFPLWGLPSEPPLPASKTSVSRLTLPEIGPRPSDLRSSLRRIPFSSRILKRGPFIPLRSCDCPSSASFDAIRVSKPDPEDTGSGRGVLGVGMGSWWSVKSLGNLWS